MGISHKNSKLAILSIDKRNIVSQKKYIYINRNLT